MGVLAVPKRKMASGLAAGVSVSVAGIEVTQAIQNLAHQVPLIAGKATVVRVYLNRWQTIGIGLFSPSTEVDVNQFPGAKAIELRVLQSDGFSEQEVFKETKTF